VGGTFRITALLTALGLLASGCASSSSDGSGDPYFGAPRITDHVARSISLGTRKGIVYKRLGGRSTAGYVHGAAAPFVACWFYPVKGTVRDNHDGTGDAVEWMFCFNSHGRLAKKHRYPFGKASDLPHP
jgi:hypothetical protein